MKRIASAVCGLLLLAPLAARAALPGYPVRDHLVPEASVFAAGEDGYSAADYDKTFAPFLRSDVMVRMIAAPAFAGRYAVGLREASGGYVVFGLALGRSGKPVAHCEAVIARPLGQDLIAAWRAVLLGTRFSDDVAFGADGIWIHFSMRETFEQPPRHPQVQFLYGQVWSPQQGSPPHRLLLIADALYGYCVTHDRDALPDIGKAAAALGHVL